MTRIIASSSEASLPARLWTAFDGRAESELLCVLSRGKPVASFTGSQLRAAVEDNARQLTAWLGDEKGVAVLAFPAGPEFVSTALACLVSGVTAVPVSMPRRGSASERLSHIVRDCGATAVLCLSGAKLTIEAALGESHVPVVSLPLDPADLPPPARSPFGVDRATAIVQYTSGSTHSPKGVAITGDNILANCDLVMRFWGMDANCRFVNWMPHYHDMGLMGGILYPMLSGGFSVQMSPYDFVRSPLAWLQAVSDWRATFSGGPAFAFSDVLRRVPRESLYGLDLSCWQCAFCGAEPVPPGLLDDFHAHLKPAGLRRRAVFACYGMAEMTLFAAGLPEDETPGPDIRGISHGCRINAELRDSIAILDPVSKTAVAEGVEGEIWLAGASQGKGYLNLPEETAESFCQTLEGSPADHAPCRGVARVWPDGCQRAELVSLSAPQAG